MRTTMFIRSILLLKGVVVGWLLLHVEKGLTHHTRLIATFCMVYMYLLEFGENNRKTLSTCHNTCSSVTTTDTTNIAKDIFLTVLIKSYTRQPHQKLNGKRTYDKISPSSGSEKLRISSDTLSYPYASSAYIIHRHDA